MKLFPFLLLLFAAVPIHAQDSIRYTADFQFTPGVYVRFQNWKYNDPLLPKDIITDLDKSSSKFFQYLLREEQFRYPENNKIVYQKTGEIFGYSTGREVYYKKQYLFEVIGAICLLKEVDVVDKYSSFINPGEQYEAARKKGSGKLYILDFKTGRFFKSKKSEVEAIFKRDPALYAQYKAAKGKSKTKIQNYIKEYNFKHPIYFAKQ
ncbi:MAG TPA: hypothetical protein PKA00_07455 [Saprospiraceae bacterium]|nr:hypothetical protein [Saprospiraceae bacterium]HMQ82727.1 hypothetical protein [Saprospiraceae bacterium]